jgi:hypothetical protein
VSPSPATRQTNVTCIYPAAVQSHARTFEEYGGQGVEMEHEEEVNPCGPPVPPPPSSMMLMQVEHTWSNLQISSLRLLPGLSFDPTALRSSFFGEAYADGPTLS